MNINSMQADFLAARAKATVTIMNATGWQQGILNPESVGIDSVFFYVFDYQTKWIWCCSVPKDAFYVALQQSENADHTLSVTRCEQRIANCAAGKGFSPEKENDLAIALVAYIGCTKTYQLSERATKANHFAVIRYGRTDTLRPFAMGGPPRHLIPADVIHDSIQKVIAIDSKNHEDWFSKS